MNLFTKQKETQRLREQTYGYPGGRMGGRDSQGVWNRHVHTAMFKMDNQVDPQDDGGVRYGDRLPPHKYIKNTSTCGTASTEHLLNTGRRPQTSQKARNSQTYLGRAKEKKNREKGRGTGSASLRGSWEGGKYSTY